MITESNTIEELGPIGRWIKFNQILENGYETNEKDRYIKKWMVIDVPETYGVLIGFRTVYEGVLKQESDYDEFHNRSHTYGYLKRTKGIYHALVVYHPRRNPVRVPLPLKYINTETNKVYIY